MSAELRLHVITRKRLREFARRHADSATPLNQWFRAVRAATWHSLDDVRRVFRHADLVPVASGNIVTVFNIGGNKYRLVAAIHYNRQRVYVLRILKHSEYSRGKWKLEL